MFTSYQACRGYEIDHELLEESAAKQVQRFKDSKKNGGFEDDGKVYDGLKHPLIQNKSLIDNEDAQQEPEEIKTNCFGTVPHKNSPWIEIFRFQISYWQTIHTIQNIFCVCILVLQVRLVKETEDGVPEEDLMLQCEEDGLIWHNNGFRGFFFIFAHTFLMITAALQVERTFYAILHKTSYFQGEIPLTHSVIE